MPKYEAIGGEISDEFDENSEITATPMWGLYLIKGRDLIGITPLGEYSRWVIITEPSHLVFRRLKTKR